MIELSELKYLTSNQISFLKRNKIQSVENLIFYFPRRYIDYSQKLDLKTTKPGDLITVFGEIIYSNVLYGRKRRLLIKVKIENSLVVEVIFFQGIHYYQKLFSVEMNKNRLIVLSGEIQVFSGKLSMTHPEFEFLTSEDLIHTNKIIPIYKITDGMRKNYITSKSLREYIYKALKQFENDIFDFLKASDLKTLNLISTQKSLLQIHFPKNWDDINEAKERLAFNELLDFSIVMQHKIELRKKIKKNFQLIENKEVTNYVNTLLASLPFSLTKSQEKSVHLLKKKAYHTNPFAILLQGDVGSGKTLVALLLALEYVQNEIQVAFLAPTEVLARQHLHTFQSFLHYMPLVIQIDLLVGSEKTSKRKLTLNALKTGSIHIIIGTHALIQEGVEFYNLGLVVIDEQHRFGVEQREALRKKGLQPDLLAMTATPIPRSLILSYYSDLEVITLKEKPKNRLPIDTRFFYETDLDRIYKSVIKYIEQGRQTYIVYPIINETDKMHWASLNEDFDYLKNQVFSEYKLDLLHGQLKSQEKELAMQKFKEGSIQILVCTTVVEVGIDVPNSNIIIIRNAEKFGLSQLHQLRGRVGRSEHQSFCILVASNNITPDGEKRLSAMINSNDGFYLAEKDLEIRGSGEVFGIKQAGKSEFKVADLQRHHHLILKAHKFLQDNPTLLEELSNKKKLKKKSKQNNILFAN